MQNCRSHFFYPCRRSGSAALCGVVFLALIGCEEPQVKKYTAPRETKEPDWLRSYQVPEGWTRMGQPVELSVMSFRIGDGDNTVVATVSRFPGKGGGLTDNINRWRKKVGWDEPLDAKQVEKELLWLTVDGEKTPYVDLKPAPKKEAGPDAKKKETAPDPALPPGHAKVKKDPERILGAVAERGPVTWFFKMQGPPDLIEKQKAKFEAFVQSIKFGATGASDG